MAALPYMKFYVADYLGDTYHLTTEEHGAYLLLIMNYWQSGKPIHESRLASAARLSSERWTDVERTLKEFFIIDEEGFWNHNRIDGELAEVRAKSVKASVAGKASAAKRKAQAAEKERESNERSTDVQQETQRTLNHTDTHTETNTDKTTTTGGSQKKCPYQKIVAMYHEKCPGLPEMRVLTPTRKSHMRARWQEYPDLQSWSNFFEIVMLSKFLTGQTEPLPGRKVFKASLDWLIKSENFAKVIERKYG